MKYAILLVNLAFCLPGFGQKITKDSIVTRIIYRDTVIYRYDTVRVKHYVHSDTIWQDPKIASASTGKKWRMLNPNNWGIGPSVGAYYSPINGFDVNIGFGIQYYILAIPSFRNPHTGHRRQK